MEKKKRGGGRLTCRRAPGWKTRRKKKGSTYCYKREGGKVNDILAERANGKKKGEGRLLSVSRRRERRSRLLHGDYQGEKSTFKGKKKRRRPTPSTRVKRGGEAPRASPWKVKMLAISAGGRGNNLPSSATISE